MDKEYHTPPQLPETDPEENLLERILQVVNAVKHPDISNDALLRKEKIFSSVESKIARKTHSSSTNFHFRRIRYQLAAAALLLILLSGGLLTYQLGYKTGKNLLYESRVEVICPLGIQTRVTLPDGSLVVLNSGSKLVYPSAFAEIRKVSLEGQGYFEVAKDKTHPFVVNTQGMDVRVLGTRFSLSAYADDLFTTLTLEEGKVEALTQVNANKEKILLVPDQQLVLDNQSGELLKRNVDAGDYTDWRDGKLIFRDLPLEEIVRILERNFNMEIVITDTTLAHEKYYVAFNSGENVKQILSLLSYKNGWSYKQAGSKIEIYKSIN